MLLIALKHYLLQFLDRLMVACFFGPPCTYLLFTSRLIVSTRFANRVYLLVSTIVLFSEVFAYAYVTSKYAVLAVYFAQQA